eukprot:207836-Prymnesium_polylepis.2
MWFVYCESAAARVSCGGGVDAVERRGTCIARRGRGRRTLLRVQGAAGRSAKTNFETTKCPIFAGLLHTPALLALAVTALVENSI